MIEQGTGSNTMQLIGRATAKSLQEELAVINHGRKYTELGNAIRVAVASVLGGVQQDVEYAFNAHAIIHKDTITLSITLTKVV